MILDTGTVMPKVVQICAVTDHMSRNPEIDGNQFCTILSIVGGETAHVSARMSLVGRE